ncbi:helix-turn-helix transcriptional regulator [Spirillospora sp. NPDC047279]|uniref:helix-turn-helix domain-containing protein n=1 Tax=Spirillospora sp. NPDC047279 TaxID=3155478 RepID=UPI0033D80008
MNDLLRRALADAQLAEDSVAARLGVDPKTVRRWLSGRVPYPRHRERISTLLGVDEAELWPQLAKPRPFPEPPSAQILATYPHRWSVPRSVWQHLFEGAHQEICVLAYAGLFLAEDTGLMRLLADRARAGVPMRILLGDPEGSHVTERGDVEGLEDSLSAKIRNVLWLYRPLHKIETVEIRLHDTVLYNSIYRADDDLLINTHAYGIAASDAPVLHLRRAAHDDMTRTYLESFERVWDGAVSLG